MHGTLSRASNSGGTRGACFRRDRPEAVSALLRRLLCRDLLDSPLTRTPDTLALVPKSSLTETTFGAFLRMPASPTCCQKCGVPAVNLSRWFPSVMQRIRAGRRVEPENSDLLISLKFFLTLQGRGQQGNSARHQRPRYHTLI